MAHGAFHTVGGMRAGFPLLVDRLVAGGTGIPGWNQPMEYMRGLLLLSHGRLVGSSQKEQSKQGGAEDTRAETIHGKILLSRSSECEIESASQSVIHITSHQNYITSHRNLTFAGETRGSGPAKHPSAQERAAAGGLGLGGGWPRSRRPKNHPEGAPGPSLLGTGETPAASVVENARLPRNRPAPGPPPVLPIISPFLLP